MGLQFYLLSVLEFSHESGGGVYWWECVICLWGLMRCAHSFVNSLLRYIFVEYCLPNCLLVATQLLPPFQSLRAPSLYLILFFAFFIFLFLNVFLLYFLTILFLHQFSIVEVYSSFRRIKIMTRWHELDYTIRGCGLHILHYSLGMMIWKSNTDVDGLKVG